jgi:methyl-accepting chemotaxis protein
MVRFGIGTKLALGFAGVLLLLVISSGVNYWNVKFLEGELQRLTGEEFTLTLAAKDLAISVQAQSQQIMAYAATRDARQPPRIKEGREATEQYLSWLEFGAQSRPELSPLVEKLRGYQQTFNNLVDKVLTAPDSTAPQQLILMADNARNLGDVLSKAVEEVNRYQDATLTHMRAEAEASARRAVMAGLMLTVAAVVLGCVVSFLIHRVITGPVRRLTDELSEIAKGAGDLTKTIEIHSQDELGQLARSFNEMVSGLGGMVAQIVQAGNEINELTADMRESSGGVSRTVCEVSEAIRQVAIGAQSQSSSLKVTNQTLCELRGAVEHIATGAQKQAAHSQQMSDLVEDMVRTLSQVAEEAGSVSEESRQAARAAEEGAEVINQTLESMSRIRNVVRDAAASVEELGESGRRIGAILDVVTGIAKKTNLLALNAAIEAARVGSAGRGFAVVAEEIRNLADGASRSVTEIAGLLSGIERGTAAAVAAARIGTVEVEEGSRLATRAGEALTEILSRIQQADVGVHRISSASQKVAESTREVSRSVMEMAGIVEENTAATEEMAAGADHIVSSVETVAQVSESQSVVADQVAASADRTRGAVHDIASRIDRLSQVAERLQALVSRFRV